MNTSDERHQVYIDATVPSYLVAPPSPDLKIAEWQRITRPHTRLKIEQVCREAGYSPPRIDSPMVILQASLTSSALHEGETLMISPHDPAKDIYEAKERIVALFGDLETYLEFMMKRQERLIKQGVKFVDLPEVRVNPPEKSDD